MGARSPTTVGQGSLGQGSFLLSPPSFLTPFARLESSPSRFSISPLSTCILKRRGIVSPEIHSSLIAIMIGHHGGGLAPSLPASRSQCSMPACPPGAA
eukprot:scaffold292847_cov35-Tisochrysis_lutea.AAC.1